MKLNMNLNITSTSSAAEWVKQNRINNKLSKEKEKELALLKEKEYEEEDEMNNNKYNSSDLKGLKIKHDNNDFNINENVILTLADQSILNYDEKNNNSISLNNDNDILENVNIADKDRRIENEQKKRRLSQPLYSGLDDYEFQPGVKPGTKAPILAHYDEFNPNKNKNYLELGEGGTIELGNLANIGKDNNSNNNIVSLNNELKYAGDYFTPSEIKFKKNKKDKKIKNKNIRKKDNDDNNIDNIDITVPIVDKKPIQFQSIDLDEDDPDLSAALIKARNLALSKKQKSEDNDIEDKGAAIALALASKLPVTKDTTVKDNNIDGDEDLGTDGRRSDGTLVFNTTTEFATRLQARLNDKARLKTEAMVKELERSNVTSIQNKRKMSIDDDNIGAIESKDNDVVMNEDEMMMLAEGNEDNSIENNSQVEEEEEEGGDPLQQPLVAKGMAATLALLKGSGELKQKEQLAGRAKDTRAIDPSRQDFGVKLEYRDEHGRKLTQKEAFRQLSYRFHGYGPSRKTLEKRMKTMEAQSNIATTRNNILEGAGGTMKSLTQTQEATGKAHVTIQGGLGNAPPPAALAAKLIAKKNTTKISKTTKKK